jgi:hypothetical protein
MHNIFERISSLYTIFCCNNKLYLQKRIYSISSHDQTSTRLESWVGVLGAPTTNPPPFKIRNRRCARKRWREKENRQEKELMGTRKDDVAAGKTYSIRLPKWPFHPSPSARSLWAPQPPPRCSRNPPRRMTETPLPGSQATARPPRFHFCPHQPKLRGYPLETWCDSGILVNKVAAARALPSFLALSGLLLYMGGLLEVAIKRGPKKPKGGEEKK